MTIASLWQAFNQKHWAGQLDPTPIWFPATSPYGRWAGCCTGTVSGQTHHIQILRNLDLQKKADVLLHEMIHQYLIESKKNPNHNAVPWCSEIMRLAKEIWDKVIWASPSSPRRGQGRVQKESPDGEPSIPRQAIASFPHSLELSVRLTDYL